jgi:peptide-methionine (S)-S-oxide reductase
MEADVMTANFSALTFTRRATCCAVVLLSVLALPACAAEEARAIPAYAGGPVSANASTETAVLAGGCFWGVQGVFQHVTGVTRAVSGYAGGNQATAEYEQVGRGDTSHAESVQITFDPRQISYAQILQIYFSVAHDPTQLNRQGPDRGTQYRSAIFPLNEGQAQIARDYIAQLNRARVFPAAIVTTIEPGVTFYAAEAYHQDYLYLNPREPYIVANDLPKIDHLQRIFPAQYRSQPTLVSAR